MKVAIYPGSFNPWHQGHKDVVEKALTIFDKVIIAQGINPDKKMSDISIPTADTYGVFGPRVQVAKFRGLLADFVSTNTNLNISAVIRGLRNIQDFEFERVQQYHNEDLGLTIPTIYLICDRTMVHISSSAIRAIKAFKDE